MKTLTTQQLQDILNITDLTNTPGHCINLMLQEIELRLSKLNVDIQTKRYSPITTIEDNYDRLYYPQTDVTKSSIYTRYVDTKHILRTQTTSGIPQLLKEITSSDSIYLLPGMVYRRDVIDRTHVGEPHQLDIWRISNKKRYTRQDLLELVELVIDAVLPGSVWRYNETNHHYTQDGIEVEVLKDGKWLEILECGLILPRLLDDNGLDSHIWSGLAMGIGLDRSVMIRKNIDDIRILRSSDPRIANQMTNLDVYKPVSNYPLIRKDLSIAIDKSYDIELIGDLIRTNVKNVDWIEEITIKSETDYENLPPHVSERLGMDNSMKNILIGLLIRSIDRNLTTSEVNSIMEDLYVKIHSGKKGYLKTQS
jgi:phenylalanyl-tRNA synthetase alpha chain